MCIYRGEGVAATGLGWGPGKRNRSPSRATLCLGDKSRWKQQLCVHVGSATDKWDEEPYLGQCVETAAGLVPRWMVINVFRKVFSESMWPWGPTRAHQHGL